MSMVELSSGLFAELAGWQVMKQAREIVAGGRVLDSEWQPPILRGTVQTGTGTCRSGLVLKSKSDVENMCPCKDSRVRGIICAHAVAVGLHVLEKQTQPVPNQASPSTPSVSPRLAPPVAPAARKAKALKRAAPGQEGEELEIYVILPPNLEEAIQRGQLMVCLEARWVRGRGLLNTLPFDRSFSILPEDRPLLDAMEALNDGDTPGLIRLTRDQFAAVLNALQGHPRVSSGKSREVSISADPVRVCVSAELKPDGEILLRMENGPRIVLGTERLWCLQQGTFYPLALPAGCAGLVQQDLRIPRSQVPFFVSQVLPALTTGTEFKSDFVPEEFELAEGKPRFRLAVSGGVAMLQARLECSYAGAPVSTAEAGWIPDPGNLKRYIAPNLSLEQEALSRLMRAGFTGPDAEGCYHLKGQEKVLNFFARDFPWMQREWETSFDERLQRSAATNIERIEPEFQVTGSGEEWFDFQVRFRTQSGQQFSPADIQRLLRSGQSHTRLPNGKFALLDTDAVAELDEVLVDCAPEQRGGAYHMKQSQAGFLYATVRTREGWDIQAPADWNARIATQRGQTKPIPPALGDLEPVLRPYQKEGVAWLRFLREHGFGGILADEMGLGKTLQVLAHLLVLKRNGEQDRKTQPAPSLVVCPSSLVFNWAAEAARFTPQLRTLAIHGSDRRDLFSAMGSHDLLITSYALLRRDAENYRGMIFDSLILDEAQHIKNRQTQNAQAVKSIRARHRLVLTGTPLENSVLDLWSIFDFLMPGYLGVAKDFRERYEVPIAREKDGAVQERLARRVQPFMLRRLKREVAKDLPEKIEQVGYCDMSEAQAALYQQILEASRAEIVNAVGADGLARSRMVVLTALLRLRQICCDPRLLKLEKVNEETPATPAEKELLRSGKLELFDELLEEILDGGHRVLVFSQFTTMLGLLRQQLDQQGIGYCYLDGSTKDRAAVVQRFQTDGSVPVFLISLKAGGVGLNLTGADTVIHFDPWWNPAVEAQAADRAHRIGQKKVVTSYKLITRGTVEEKILNLQQRKKSVIDAMLGDEQQLAETLTWNEIQELISS